MALSSSVESDGCADPVAILPSATFQRRLESPSEQPAAGADHRARVMVVSSQSRCLFGTAVAHPGSTARDPVHAEAHAEFEMVLGRPRGAWRFDDSVGFCGIPQLGRAGVPRLASAPDAASNNGKQKSRSTTPIKTTLFKWFPSWTGSVSSKRWYHLRVQSNPILNGFLVQLRGKLGGGSDSRSKDEPSSTAGHGKTKSIEEMRKTSSDPLPTQGPALRTQRCAARKREDGCLLGTRAHSRERVCGEQRDLPLALLPPGTPRTSSSTPPAGHARARSDRDLGSPRARWLHRPAPRSPSYLYPRAPRAALLVLAPPPPCAPMSRIPANTGTWRIPASAPRNAHTMFLLHRPPPEHEESVLRLAVGLPARAAARRNAGAALLALAPHLRVLVATPTPFPTPRWPRTRTPERPAHASLTTFPRRIPASTKTRCLPRRAPPRTRTHTPCSWLTLATAPPERPLPHPVAHRRVYGDTRPPLSFFPRSSPKQAIFRGLEKP
ncbi:hypothetical protein DFH09DRAFT_1102481 [Mycena vulgaris]|nr:hypothetical protein DFH09DRAFT_1102481 [Mycena vulgaris]